MNARVIPLVLVLTALWRADALACAVCGCGDPTLTAMGTEKPYKNRVRAGVELKLRTDEAGGSKLSEQRLDLNVAWAPHPRVFLLASMPFLRRDLTEPSLKRTQTLAPGEAELRAKFFVFQDRELFPRHLLSVTAGIKLPTSPVIANVPLELQSGTGSVDPLLAFSYAYFAYPTMVYTSVQGTYPTPGRGLRASPSLRTTTTVQRNITEWFAPRIGFDTRLDGVGYEDGKPAPDTGGFISFLSAELLFLPAEDLMLFSSLRVPFLNALWGRHVEGPFFSAGLAYDFSP